MKEPSGARQPKDGAFARRAAPDRIRRIMRQRGLRAIQPKTYVPKTSDGRADKPSPNLLLDQPLPAKPD